RAGNLRQQLLDALQARVQVAAVWVRPLDHLDARAELVEYAQVERRDSRVDDADEVELVDARRHRERDPEVAGGRLDDRGAGRDRAVAQAAFDDVAGRA